MPNRKYCTAGSKKERVIRLRHRADRGLPSYDRTNNKELRNIASRRWPNSSTLNETSRRELIEMMEQADEEGQKFGRFLELPPELRVRIYELHFESFGTVYGPSDPPITKVSRVVRQESLALFYQQVRYDMHFEMLRKAYTDIHQARVPRGMWYFLQNVDEQRMLWMRRLKISYTVRPQGRMQSWNVIFSPDRKSCKVEECTEYGLASDVRERQLARLDNIFREVLSWEGRRVLSQEDLVPLCSVVWNAIKGRYPEFPLKISEVFH